MEDDRWMSVAMPDLAARAVDAALLQCGLDPTQWEVTLLACNDARIKTLNADFRGKPQPTNVLSWPSEERAANPGEIPDPPSGDRELGDIALAYDTCAAEASSGNKPLNDHVTHLVVHGVLHLLGYDHQNDSDADLMETMEIAILGKLGLSNPYDG